MEKPRKICSEHGNEPNFFCIGKSCRCRFFCVYCFLKHNNLCEGNTIPIYSIEEDDLSALFNSGVMNKALSPKEFNSLTNPVNRERAQTMIREMKESFFSSITASFDKIEQTVLDNLEEVTTTEEAISQIKKIVEFEKLKEVISHDMEELDSLSIIKSQDEVLEALLKLKQENLETINNGAKVYVFQDILNNIEDFVKRECSLRLDKRLKTFENATSPKHVKVNLDWRSVIFYKDEEKNDSLTYSGNLQTLLFKDFAMEKRGFYHWILTFSREIRITNPSKEEKKIAKFGVINAESFFANGISTSDFIPTSKNGLEGTLMSYNLDVELLLSCLKTNEYESPKYVQMRLDTITGTVHFYLEETYIKSIKVRKERKYLPFVIITNKEVEAELRLVEKKDI